MWSTRWQMTLLRFQTEDADEIGAENGTWQTSIERFQVSFTEVPLQTTGEALLFVE